MRLGAPVNNALACVRYSRYAVKPSQDVFIQADMIGLGKYKIQILERLSEPEALHLVRVFRDGSAHVLDSRVAVLGACRLFDVLEHAPRGFLQGLVTCDSVHDEDGLDGFGSGSLLVKEREIREENKPEFVCGVPQAENSWWDAF